MTTTFFKKGILCALMLTLFVAHQSHARTFKDLRVRNCLQAGSLNVCRNARIGGNLTVDGTISGPNGPVPIFDVDNGADVIPVNGIVQVSGLSGTGFVPSGVETHNGGTNDLFIENRRWLTEYVVDASAQVGERGTFQTIQGAINAAAAAGGDAYIAIRPGTYTEDLTFRANLHIAGASTDGRVPLVTIVGNHTYSEEGPCVLEDLAFNASSGDIFTINPTSGGQCLFVQKFCGNTNTGGRLAFVNPTGGVFAVYAQIMGQSQVQTTAIEVVDNAFILLNGTTLGNNTAVPLIRMTGSGQVNADTSGLNSQGDVFSIESANAVAQIQDSSVTSPAGYFVNFVAAGSVGAVHVTVNTVPVSGTYSVTGAGNYQYADIASFTTGGAAYGIDPATTQIPLDWQPYANAPSGVVGAPVTRGTAAFSESQFDVMDGLVTLFSPFFSYTNVDATPYVVSEVADSYLSVDTSIIAITVQLPDAPITGRTFTIKDRTGNAAANNITVTTVGGTVNIDGSASQIIITDNGSMQVIFNGTDYEIYSAVNFTIP